jgi:hypothetical protein
MAGMGDLLGGVRPDNLFIKLDRDKATFDGVRAFVGELDPDELPVSWIATDLAADLKFTDCLPEDVALEVAGARVADPAGVRRAVGEPMVTVEGVE